MNIRIQNLPADVTVEEVREFIGASDEIEKIVLGDPGDDDNVIAVIKVNTSQAGANAMAEHIDGRFFKERRLSAQALGLLTD
ncbi:MAG: RNA-binding protein [Gammaproteobacteria bacterium]|nr:RNA-binding protein [Gammaproteobacteria bacterium]